MNTVTGTILAETDTVGRLQLRFLLPFTVTKSVTTQESEKQLLLATPECFL